MDEDDKKELQLSQSVIDELTKSISAQILKSLPSNEQPPKEEKEDDVGDQSNLTSKDVAREVMKMLQNQSTESSNKVYKTLWKEKLSSATTNTEGLDDYLKGIDDYGNVREDQLNGIESYEDRIEALNKLTNSYGEAVSGKPGRRPIVDTKAIEKVKESEDKYNEVHAKMDKGEYKSIQEASEAFLNVMTEELNTLH